MSKRQTGLISPLRKGDRLSDSVPGFPLRQTSPDRGDLLFSPRVPAAGRNVGDAPGPPF